MQMNGIDILEKIKAFEASHDVAAYQADGWHVWPLIRVMLGLRMFVPVPFASGRGLRSLLLRVARPVRQWLGYWRAKFRLAWRGAAPVVTGGAPLAVFLTLSERRVHWRGAFYEIYTDPLVDIFRSLGRDTLVWESGPERSPQYSPSCKIFEHLEAEARCLSIGPRQLPAPAWYGALQPLFQELLGRGVPWEEMAAPIIRLSDQATVFERWLRQVQPSLLISVCWYDPMVMAATMAARRVGVQTVELQHGVQGGGHFAYAGWSRAPLGGYEVVPDVFWVWGKRAAKDLVVYNPAFTGHSEIVIGGSPWLDMWRSSSSREMGGGPAEKVMLLTLQWDVSPLVLEAIAQSPTEWRWLVRFHPSRSVADRAADRLLFLSTGHKGVEMGYPDDVPLYQLLNQCDAHLTGSSTCALEALAFGVPTIILADTALGKVGKVYYRHFVEQDVMHVAETATELLAYLHHVTRLDVHASVVTDCYAEEGQALHVVERLLAAMEDQGE